MALNHAKIQQRIPAHSWVKGSALHSHAHRCCECYPTLPCHFDNETNNPVAECKRTFWMQRNNKSHRQSPKSHVKTRCRREFLGRRQKLTCFQRVAKIRGYLREAVQCWTSFCRIAYTLVLPLADSRHNPSCVSHVEELRFRMLACSHRQWDLPCF